MQIFTHFNITNLRKQDKNTGCYYADTTCKSPEITMCNQVIDMENSVL